MSTVTLTTRGAIRKSDMREANERVLLNIILQNPEVSSSDVARKTGFSPSSITLIVNRMIRRGWVPKSAKRRWSGWSPPGARSLAAGTGCGSSGDCPPLCTFGDCRLERRVPEQPTVNWHPNPKLLLTRVNTALAASPKRYPARDHCWVSGLVCPARSMARRARLCRGEPRLVRCGGWASSPTGSQPRFISKTTRGWQRFREMVPWRGDPPMDQFVFVTMRDGLGTGVIIDGKLLQGASGQACNSGTRYFTPKVGSARAAIPAAGKSTPPIGRSNATTWNANPTPP